MHLRQPIYFDYNYADTNTKIKVVNHLIINGSVPFLKTLTFLSESLRTG